MNTTDNMSKVSVDALGIAAICVGDIFGSYRPIFDRGAIQLHEASLRIFGAGLYAEYQPNDDATYLLWLHECLQAVRAAKAASGNTAPSATNDAMQSAIANGHFNTDAVPAWIKAVLA